MALIIFRMQVYVTSYTVQSSRQPLTFDTNLTYSAIIHFWIYTKPSNPGEAYYNK